MRGIERPNLSKVLIGILIGVVSSVIGGLVLFWLVSWGERKGDLQLRVVALPVDLPRSLVEEVRDFALDRRGDSRRQEYILERFKTERQDNADLLGEVASQLAVIDKPRPNESAERTDALGAAVRVHTNVSALLESVQKREASLRKEVDTKSFPWHSEVEGKGDWLSLDGPLSLSIGWVKSLWIVAVANHGNAILKDVKLAAPGTQSWIECVSPGVRDARVVDGVLDVGPLAPGGSVEFRIWSDKFVGSFGKPELIATHADGDGQVVQLVMQPRSTVEALDTVQRVVRAIGVFLIWAFIGIGIAWLGRFISEARDRRKAASK